MPRPKSACPCSTMSVRKAVEHCRATGESARRALRSGQFPLATEGKVRQALARDPCIDKAERDHHSQLLTNAERMQLGHWLIERADAHEPCTRHGISVKIKIRVSGY